MSAGGFKPKDLYDSCVTHIHACVICSHSTLTTYYAHVVYTLSRILCLCIYTVYMCVCLCMICGIVCIIQYVTYHITYLQRFFLFKIMHST